MKRFNTLIFAFFFLLSPFFFLQFTKDVSAQSLTTHIKSYLVDIDVKKDSTFTVRERITYEMNGTMRGLRADIPLSNIYEEYCTLNKENVCGKFEMIVPKEITDEEGKAPTKGKTKIYKYQDEYEIEFLRFEWLIFPEGEDVRDEEFTMGIEYDIVGGLTFRDIDNKSESDIFLYWNALGREINPSNIDYAKVTINFHDQVRVDKNNLVVSTPFEVDVNSDSINRKLEIISEDIRGIGSFTIEYEFNKGEIDIPGNLNIEVKKPNLNNKFLFNGFEVFSSKLKSFNLEPKVNFENFPSGKNVVSVSNNIGYETAEEKLNLKEDFKKTIQLELEPNELMAFLLLLNKIILILSLIGLPIFAVYYFNKIRHQGHDPNYKKTVMPLFSPPEGIRPYLLGSLYDEAVDSRDLTGSIIDLAYRGYIKIKEIKKNKDYELTKVLTADIEKLDNPEMLLMEAIFGTQDVIKTSEMKYSVGTLSLFKDLNKKIYDKLVAEGYYKESPEHTRNKYLALGIVLLIFGVVITVLGSIVLSFILSIYDVFTIGFLPIIGGVIYIIRFKHLPVRTEHGSDVFNKILGFKMYLHTAERYRLQGLKPEDFEKYLSFAAVMGVEKDWAKAFEGIYKGRPDWYQGDAFDSLAMANFYNSFGRVTSERITAMRTPPAKSSSGGFGGGSSFGGFSGGGGGGGFRGGF